MWLPFNDFLVGIKTAFLGARTYFTLAFSLYAACKQSGATTGIKIVEIKSLKIKQAAALVYSSMAN